MMGCALCSRASKGFAYTDPNARDAKTYGYCSMDCMNKHIELQKAKQLTQPDYAPARASAGQAFGMYLQEYALTDIRACVRPSVMPGLCRFICAYGDGVRAQYGLGAGPTSVYPNEEEALWSGIKAGGVYLRSVNQPLMDHLTVDQWGQFLVSMVSGYYKHIESEVPF